MTESASLPDAGLNPSHSSLKGEAACEQVWCYKLSERNVVLMSLGLNVLNMIFVVSAGFSHASVKFDEMWLYTNSLPEQEELQVQG